jgi:hypothetical protein
MENTVLEERQLTKLYRTASQSHSVYLLKSYFPIDGVYLISKLESKLINMQNLNIKFLNIKLTLNYLNLPWIHKINRKYTKNSK